MISLKHGFTSPVADDHNPNEVGPDEWNAEHVMTMAADRLLGRLTTDGAAQELTASQVKTLLAIAQSDVSGLVAALAALQPLDSDVTALAANSTNGLWARTGSGTGAARTITGTANQITVSNGDGVSGNPTLSLPPTVMVATALGVGPVAPDVKVTFNDNTGLTVAPAAGTIFHLVGADAANPIFVFDTFGGIPGIQGRRANGTLASKTALSSGDAMNSIAGQGWDGSAYANAGSIIIGAAEAWGGSAHGSFISFRTVPTGSTTVGERGRFQSGFSVGTTTDPGAGAILANSSIEAITTVKTGVYTVATLPAAGAKGRRAFVSDANATTFASTVAGGGANNVPVYDDGTNWRIG